MDGNAIIGEISKDLALSLPSIITTIVSVVIIIRRWKRHPKVSLLACIGLGLLLLHGILFTVVYATVPTSVLRRSATDQDIQNLFLVLGLTFNVTRMIAFTPLLSAVFIARANPE
jgi:hypothetical protein